MVLDGLRAPRMVVGARHVLAAYRLARSLGQGPRTVAEALEALRREGVLVVGGYRLVDGDSPRVSEEEYAGLEIVKELVEILVRQGSR